MAFAVFAVLRRFLSGDWMLLSAASLLLGVSLVMLYSVSSSFGSTTIFLRQSMFVGVGLLILFTFPFFDYRHIARFSTPLYFSMMGALLLVLFFGATIRGTSGWIQFGGFQVQPVEFSKIVLALFLASFISKKRTELGDFVRLFTSFVLTAGLIVLVLRQPDLGSALVLSGMWMGMVIIAGMRKSHLALLAGSCIAAVLIGWLFLAPYQKDRILNVVNPEIDPRGSGYNVLQSLVAIGSGGITGKGVGHGSQSQSNFLPERHTDFIYAVTVEELGLVGGILTLFLYAILLWRTARIASLSSDNFGYLLALGIGCMFLIQITVNIGMNIGLLPVTGIPLPFISYGGSSLLSCCIGIVLLENIFLKRKDATPLYEW